MHYKSPYGIGWFKMDRIIQLSQRVKYSSVTQFKQISPGLFGQTTFFSLKQFKKMKVFIIRTVTNYHSRVYS